MRGDDAIEPAPRPCEQPCIEETTEAVGEGDSRFGSGSALAALSHRPFLVVYIGAFFSNIGTWMQQVVLGALAYSLTGSPLFVGLLIFAQMGPVLVFGPLAGVIADTFDRRRLLLVVNVVQLVAAGALALVARSGDPSKVAIVAAVLVGGVGGAIFMPAYSSILPALVGPDDLPGAISLQSAQMNLSRVIGPAIGGIAFAAYGASWVFLGNAVSYLFMIAAVLHLRLPPLEIPDDAEVEQGFRRLTSGFRIARRDPVVGRALITIATFSALCLLWVGQFPVFAVENLGIDEESSAYGWLYACFGLGAALGSIAIGTVFARSSKPTLVRRGLLAYAALLTVYALLRSPGPAYPVVVLLGASYFGSVTALNTAMQSRLANHERGRVMALWMMGFGGMVSVANLVLAPLVDAVGMPPLMIAGAAIAVGLAWYADIRAPGERAPSLDPTPAAAD
ncbi:MAG: MFS transporter [Actinomycetota bacterium]|nr:MFS transporter [Acidimicrobiia bacterium]MDQ3294301.1 MFS transporter [Actinomycetota bacterium]